MTDTPGTGPTVTAMERRAVDALRSVADPAWAEGARAYFKKSEGIAILGVRTPALREVARDVFRAVSGRWATADAIRFCDRMSQRRFHEVKMVGVLVLGRYRADTPRSLLPVAKRWITSGRFSNWAAIDALCPEILTPLVRRHPDLERTIERWTRARLLWLRRAAAVTLVPLARKGERLDTAYRIVSSLADEAEDLGQKAAGWLLREAGKTDMARLERFLRDAGPSLPRTTVRYAIERFPEGRRRALLTATRPSRR